MKTKCLFIISVLLLSFIATNAEAGWLVYHESAFRGKLIDADTKQPIEGAVVLVEYKKQTMNIFGGGAGNSIINVRETLTDKNGRFQIPSYMTFVDPLSWKTNSVFLIFKPGYVNLDFYLRDYLLDKKSTLEDFPWRWNKELIIKFPGNGVVELPRVKSREDRDKVLLGVDIPDPGVPAKLMPTLIRVYNEEKEYLGLQPIRIP